MYKPIHLCALALPFVFLFLRISESTENMGNSSEIETTQNGTGDIGTLIVGGVVARPNEFPWLVHMTIDNGSAKSFCGASIIDQDLLLTAAHCVNHKKIKSIEVVAGDHDRRVTNSSEQKVTGKAVRLHEKYNPNTFIHDIALVRLSKKLNFTTTVKKISLPLQGRNFTGSAVVAGWGTTNFNSQNLEYILRKVDIPIVTGRACTDQIRNATTQFCAGIGGKDSCRGDSGGPMICKEFGDTICGIVSFGTGCGDPGFPGVYTKVSAYTTWINENANFSSSSNMKSEIFFIISSALFMIFK